MKQGAQKKGLVRHSVNASRCNIHSTAALVRKYGLAQPFLQRLHFHECKFISDRSMRGISKLRGLRSLDFPYFRAIAGDLLSELAQLTDLEALDLGYSCMDLNPSRVSESCLPLSTALSLPCISGLFLQTLTAERSAMLLTPVHVVGSHAGTL